MSERSYPLTEAMSRLINNYPFYAVLLMDLLTINEYDGPPDKAPVPTAGTDGRRLFINAKWFATLTLPQRVFLLVHEIMHVILDHPARMASYRARGIGPDLKPYNNNKMNWAEDYVINGWIHESGLRDMPPGGLYNPAYGSADIADEVYCKIPDPPPSGGGFDVHMGKADDAPTPTEVQRSVKSAAEAAKSQGKLPLGMERLINEICEPQVDWATELRLMVQTFAGRDEQTFARPNRKRLVLAPHIYWPGRAGFRAGTIVMYDDRSGSVSDKEVSHFLGEMASIVEELKPENAFIGSFSTYASDPLEVGDADDIRHYKTDVGGGTHAPVVFEKLDEHNVTPDVLVMLTDGYTDFDEEPPYPVIWVMTSDVVAPYGKTIRIQVANQ